MTVLVSLRNVSSNFTLGLNIDGGNVPLVFHTEARLHSVSSLVRTVNGEMKNWGG